MIKIKLESKKYFLTLNTKNKSSQLFCKLWHEFTSDVLNESQEGHH